MPKSIQKPRIPTGSSTIDEATGGGWQPGTVIEIAGADADLADLTTSSTVITGDDPVHLMARANDALCAGKVVSLRLIGSHPALVAGVLRMMPQLSARAASTGGVLLVLTSDAQQATVPDTADMTAYLEAYESRMRAIVEAEVGEGGPGWAIVRVLSPAGPSARFRVAVG